MSSGSSGKDRSAPSHERILVVDDEVYIREILSRWLATEGYDCDVASTAEEALEALQSDAFCLVVLDIMLPGRSGIDILSLLREQFPDVAVIMATALDDRTLAIRALELGAYGYVIKPFEHNEVMISVVNALERRRLALASQEYERSLEERVRHQTEDIRKSREEITLRLVAAQEYRHDETGAHIRRLGLYAGLLGQLLGYSDEHKDVLRLAAPMHDVGKIGIPDSILMKPAKLTDEEFEIMKRHTIIGARILEGSDIPLVETARSIALCHHEKWGGSGYPQGLSDGAIPEEARIVGVLDVYDAMVHDRVHRRAIAEEDALAMIVQGRGTQFAPDLVDVFLEALPELRRIREQIKSSAAPSTVLQS